MNEYKLSDNPDSTTEPEDEIFPVEPRYHPIHKIPRKMSNNNKEMLKRELVDTLVGDEQIEKIVVFGSFASSLNPHDMDIAVFCHSKEDYLTLALAFRKKLRQLSKRIPIDLLPITIPFDSTSAFIAEINKGEVVYEKRY